MLNLFFVQQENFLNSEQQKHIFNFSKEILTELWNLVLYLTMETNW